MTKTKSKKKIVILCVMLAVVIALLAVLGVRIAKRSSWGYTEEQHLRRISKLVEKRYMSGDYDFTSYEITPLYDKNEKLHYCVVDFEPYGFVWVRINDFAFLQSLYTRDEECISREWSRFEYIDTTQKSYAEENIKWETDENGDRIYYNVNPYKAAGIKDERKYLLTMEQAGHKFETIPAVKRGDKFLNLMDMKEFEYVEKSETYKYPCFGTQFPPKSFFDL